VAHVYVAVADIQKEFKSVTFAATTTPTDSTVDDMIDEEEAEVDSVIGMKYDIPLDASSRAFKLCKKLVKKLVCGRIKNIIAVKSGSSDANQGKVSDGDAMIKESKDTLKLIRDGEIDLKILGATLLGSDDGVKSFNVDNEGSLDEDDVDDVEDRVVGSAASPLNSGSSIPSFQRGKRSW
jgi:hypothetical protein